jgi:hypothetical protein
MTQWFMQLKISIKLTSKIMIWGIISIQATHNLVTGLGKVKAAGLQMAFLSWALWKLWPLVKPTYNNRLCICFECINSHVVPKIHGKPNLSKTLYCFKLVIYLLHTPARYTVLAFCAPIKQGFYRPGNEIRRGKQ